MKRQDSELFGRKKRLITAFLTLAALLSAMLSCETEAKVAGKEEDGLPEEDGPVATLEGFALTDASAAVSASGGSVRLSFDSDREGTFYALVLPADADAPEGADGVKDDPSATGAMTEGANTFTVSGLDSSGVYTAYITAEALETEEEAEARAGAEGAEEAEPAPVLSRVLAVSGIKPAPFTGISGTEWYMGVGRLTFGANGKVSIHGFSYDYTWDAGSRGGWVSGHINQRDKVYDGKGPGDIINALGSYSVNMNQDGYIEGITFDNYRDTNYIGTGGGEVRLDLTFTPARAAVPPERLTGTCWSWGGSGLTLEFMPNGKVLQWSPSGYYPHPHIYSGYWFDPEYDYSASYPGDPNPIIEVGYIEAADRLCSYSGAPTALGAFVIMHDFKDETGTIRERCLYFPGPESRYWVRELFNGKGYKSYTHRADYAKRTDD